MQEHHEKETWDTTDTCPKCGSRHWMVDLPLMPFCYFVVSAVRGGDRGCTTFTASMCGDCGYSEFYAKNYEKVFKEWRKHNM